MLGIISMLSPVIRHVIEPNIEVINALPPMANLGERAFAMVSEINATVVIRVREPMS